MITFLCLVAVTALLAVAGSANAATTTSTFDATATTVTPAYRSGAAIRFPVRREHGVVLRLQLPNGNYVPAGASVGVDHQVVRRTSVHHASHALDRGADREGRVALVGLCRGQRRLLRRRNMYPIARAWHRAMDDPQVRKGQ